MDPYQIIELVGAACLVLTGLSHVLHPEAWSALFQRWARDGASGALVNGLLHFAAGLFFVATHPVFSGWSSMLTYWACAVAIKGALYLVIPAVGLKSMRALTPEKARRMRWAGLPMIGLGIAIAAVALA